MDCTAAQEHNFRGSDCQTVISYSHELAGMVMVVGVVIGDSWFGDWWWLLCMILTSLLLLSQVG